MNRTSLNKMHKFLEKDKSLNKSLSSLKNKISEIEDKISSNKKKTLLLLESKFNSKKIVLLDKRGIQYEVSKLDKNIEFNKIK